MPVFQYEAMDNTGLEIKETIEAANEAEAQQKIRDKGFFVTKIQERAKAKKKKNPPRRRPPSAKRAGSPSARSRPSTCVLSPGSFRRCKTRACPFCGP
jgi:type IV pilus assembly protein PilC